MSIGDLSSAGTLTAGDIAVFIEDWPCATEIKAKNKKAMAKVVFFIKGD